MHIGSDADESPPETISSREPETQRAADGSCSKRQLEALLLKHVRLLPAWGMHKCSKEYWVMRLLRSYVR
jgi:hypothetical protein